MKAESHEIKLQTFNSGKTVISQPVLPVIKINDKCPLGYQSSNGYCIPNNSRVMGYPAKDLKSFLKDNQ